MMYRIALSVLLLCGLLLAACNEQVQPGKSAEKTPVSNNTATSDESIPSSAPASPLEPVTVEKIQAVDSSTQMAILSNGMTVIIKPVRTTPVVCVRGFVRAGGMYEGQWLGCGLSHLLEHLCAKETVSGQAPKPKPDGAFDKRPRSNGIGGLANAYTTGDHTCYYISAAADKTDDCIDLVAGQLLHPDITQADFDREHGVVQRELLMGKDNPGRILYYAHAKNIFGDHPAAVPTIGYAKPLADVTRDDVLAYHGMLYQPQHMVMVIVGDIDPVAALKTVLASVQNTEKGRAYDYILPKVRPFSGVRRVVLPSPRFKETAEMLSFQTIPLVHDDLYPLDVLSTILTTGQSSRLIKSMVFEKKLVTSIDSYSHTPAWGKGTFTFTFRTAPEKADVAEKMLLDEAAAVVASGVTAEELERAKQMMVSSYVHSQQTMESISSSLGGDFLSTGDPLFSKQYTARIQDVTAEQVQAAAKKYFNSQNMVITRVVPDSAFKADKSEATKTEQGETKIFTLSNGLKVILKPTDAIDLVSMAFACRGGLLKETPDNNGLGNLMAILSSRGAGDYSAEQISGFFNAAGGSISATCGDNSYLYTASLLADGKHPQQLEKALNIFADVIMTPTFKEEELEKIRPLCEAAVKRVDEDWNAKLSKHFREKFFTTSSWKMLSQGNLDVIEKATPKDIAAWHKQAIAADGAVLTVVGHFDPATVEKMLRERFSQLPKGKPYQAKFDKRAIAPDELYVIPSKTQQAGIMIASPGTTNLPADKTDRLALLLLDTIISGYRLPSGWLHSELRGKQLVYVVHAYHKAGLIPGAFITYAGTMPDKAPEVVAIILKHLNRAASYTPTEAELKKAVNAIVTADLLGSQGISSIAVRTTLDELYGNGHDWLKHLQKELSAITPEQVRAAAGKFLGQGFVTVVITPQPEQFKPQTSQTE